MVCVHQMRCDAYRGAQGRIHGRYIHVCIVSLHLALLMRLLHTLHSVLHTLCVTRCTCVAGVRGHGGGRELDCHRADGVHRSGQLATLRVDDLYVWRV